MSGIFRIWISISIYWILYALWSYAPGADLEYKKYDIVGFHFDKIDDLAMNHLPSIKQYKELRQSSTPNTYTELETKWLQLTQGRLPDLYLRPINENSCNKLIVLNYGGAPVDFITTCRTQWSWVGLGYFLILPLVFFTISLAALSWIALGFKKK